MSRMVELSFTPAPHKHAAFQSKAKLHPGFTEA